MLAFILILVTMVGSDDEPTPTPAPPVEHESTGTTKSDWEPREEPLGVKDIPAPEVNERNEPATPKGVQWRDTYAAARKEAIGDPNDPSDDRYLLVVFSLAEGCAPCKRLAGTFTDPEVAEYVNEHFVPVMNYTGVRGIPVRRFPTLWCRHPGGQGLVQCPVKTDRKGLLAQLKALRSKR